MPVPSSINDLSTTAGDNYPTGGESPGGSSSPDDFFRAHASFIAQLRDQIPAAVLPYLLKAGGSMTGLLAFAAGADIASASTINLTAATGNICRVTGTVATTGWTINAGQIVKLVAAGAWPLTYHATNNPLPGGVNYTCTAGDVLTVSKDGSGAIHIEIVKVGGDAVVGSPVIRQTVQSGVTDSNGYANMLSAGTGLALNLAATAKPMKINFAAGLVDYSSTLSADVTSAVSGLTANTTNYIFATYVSATSVTWGKTTIAPIYSYAAPTNTNGQYWFNLADRTMYLGNGTTWTAVNVVFVGECVTGASSVSSVTNYALNRQYNSGWFSVASTTTYNKASNLGIDPSLQKVTVLYRQNSSYVPRVLIGTFADSSSNVYGCAAGPSGRNNARVRTGAYVASGTGDLSSLYGANDGSTTTTGEYCLIVEGF